MQQQQGEDLDLQQTSPLSVAVPPEDSHLSEVSLLLHFLLSLGQSLSLSDSPPDLSGRWDGWKVQGCWARPPPPRAAARTSPPAPDRGRGQVKVGQGLSSGSGVYLYWYFVVFCALLQKSNNDSKLTTLIVLDLVTPRSTLPRRVSCHRVLSSSQGHRVIAS